MTILTQNFADLKAQVEAHLKADEVVKGLYWEDGKGCFIGCLSHSDDPLDAVKRFGLTEPILRIAESIFESLPDDEAKAFFAALPDAIGRDGKDLSLVHWQFLAAELRALPTQRPDIQAVIDPVIEGMDLLAAGKEWADATYAARAAADATLAAYAAARAAAKLRQRDTLLRLIAEAPVKEMVK